MTQSKTKIIAQVLHGHCACLIVSRENGELVPSYRECHREDKGESVRGGSEGRWGRNQGLYLSLSDGKQSKCAEVHCFFSGVESLDFHRLTEHRHGEYQAQDL